MNMWKELTTKFFNSPEAADIFNRLSKKEVPFRFAEKPLSFSLSQSLFSSHDIDSGSKMLLKSIQKQIELNSINKIMDIGCGIGTLAVSLAAVAEHASITVEDRNFLATLFTVQNAIKNGIDPSRITARCQLAFEKESNEKQDLIVCNIPAKAGEPVIHALFEAASHSLSKDGKAAIVIVKPLAQTALKIADSLNLTKLYEEQNNDYLVMHFAASESNEENDSTMIEFSNYVRVSDNFNLQECDYWLDTVYNLPDFDQAGIGTRQAAAMISEYLTKNSKTQLKIAIIGPGQGHLPLLIAKSLIKKNIKSDIGVFSHDRLELFSSKHNLDLIASTLPIRYQSNSSCAHHWELFEQPETAENQWDLIIFNPQGRTTAAEIEQHSKMISKVSVKSTKLILAGRSSDVTHYQNALKDFSLVRNKKSRGHRGLTLIRK